MTDDVYVYIVDFGVSNVTETVTQNDDGSYSVFLNARLSYEAQVKGYYHALCHIQNNDFEKNDVDSIENKCHKIA